MNYCPHCGSKLKGWYTPQPIQPYTPYTPYPTYPYWFTTNGADKTPPNTYGDMNGTQRSPQN